MNCNICKADLTTIPYVTLHNPEGGALCTTCVYHEAVKVIKARQTLAAARLPSDKQH
jgi:hypothetical protein